MDDIWKKTTYHTILGIILIISLFLTYMIINQYKFNYKPNFKITYYPNYNSTTCEVNIDDTLTRRDLYDFCPYVIHIIESQKTVQEMSSDQYRRAITQNEQPSANTKATCTAGNN